MDPYLAQLIAQPQKFKIVWVDGELYVLEDAACDKAAGAD